MHENNIEWYHDIPEQGILCVVFSDVGEIRNFTLITNYVNNLYRDVYGDHWSNARPATLDDMKNYLQQELK